MMGDMEATAAALRATLVDRDGCWTIEGHKPDAQGYVRLWRNGRIMMAHRRALAWFLGRQLGDRMTASHRCHDMAAEAGLCEGGPGCLHRRCCRPDHLVEESRADNVRSSPLTINRRNSSKTLCPRGHPLEGDNLMAGRLRRGQRICRTCHGSVAFLSEEARARRNALARLRYAEGRP